MGNVVEFKDALIEREANIRGMRAEIEALEDLTTSAGWAIFLRLVEDRFNIRRFRGDLSNIVKSGQDLQSIGSAALQLSKSYDAVDMLLALPTERLEILRKSAEREGIRDANRR